MIRVVLRNGCGFLFNWLRIYYRGRIFFDIVGRSLFCGIFDLKGRKRLIDMLILFVLSFFFVKFDRKELFFLVDSGDNEGW